MISIPFTCERAASTHATQVLLAAPPFNFLWKPKTILKWSEDVTELDQLKIDEVTRRAAWRNAAALWDFTLREIQLITREVKREGVFAFGADAVKRQEFEELLTDAKGRNDIYDQGLEALEAWKNADPAWSYSDDVVSAGFGSLLAASLAQKQTHLIKEKAWKRAANRLLFKARKVDADNVAWFAAASRKFKKGTEGGDLLRSNVPTTTRPEPAVGQGQISHVMVQGNTVHFDFNAEHATHFAVLHREPGSPVLLIVVADTTEKSVTFQDLAAGVHHFAVIPSNSGGEGAQSVAVPVQVSQQAAA